MTKSATLILLLGAPLLSACIEGVRTYQGDPNSVIATALDAGTDDVGLVAGDAAIAYDPDGCQGWIIDDGLEGYSGRRYDPATGLPICNNLYPPGTVIGNYQSQSPGLVDYIPGHRTDLVFVDGEWVYYTYPESYIRSNPVDTVPDQN